VPLDPTSFLRAAVERGLLGPLVSQTVLGGNHDRRTERLHLQVQEARGRSLKVTIGADLSEIRRRADLFHATLPDHSAGTVFFLAVGKSEIWAQEWIEGPALDQPLASMADVAHTVFTLEKLEQALQSTATPSTRAAWQDEFDSWSRLLVDLDVWTRGELTDVTRLLPQLGALLRSTTLERRWSNGDFLAANIKPNVKRKPVLLDFEYGGQTHFFPEDRTRFSRLSPNLRIHPGICAGFWPDHRPPSAWELFFALRQLGLEVNANQSTYLARTIPVRKAQIRFAAESLGWPLPEWTVAAQPPEPSQATETVQLFWEVDGDWRERDSQRIEVLRGRPQFVAFRVPSKIRKLRLDPVASLHPVQINALCALRESGTLTDLAVSCTAVGATLDRVAGELRVSPNHADPQLFLNLPDESAFLLVEMTVSKSPLIFDHGNSLSG
jgi:hypothetical protein